MIETFYDTDGNPISLEVYLALTEDGTEQTIKEDKLDNGLIVRTIWVGMNLQPEPDGPLQIIETTVIDSSTNERCLNTRWTINNRYSSEREAKSGHNAIRKECENWTAIAAGRDEANKQLK